MDKPLRLAIAQISHETNTFSPIPTGLAQFAERELHYGEEIFAVYRDTRTGISGFMDAARAAERERGRPIDLIPTVSASATPSGTVTREAYDHLVGTLREGLVSARQQGGLDGVLLALHGAMVVEGITDAEGDLLEKVRQEVGPAVPVMSTLDLHGNISPKIVRNATALFGYDTNPHVDKYERAVEATPCLLDTLAGRVRPTMALEKRPMMAPTINMRTAEGPMAHLFELARRFEAEPGVINVSVFGGFPFSDIAEVGLAVVATTDNDPALAGRVAKAVADEAWAIRGQFLKPLVPVREAVAHAMSLSAQAVGKPGPIILADVADNPGGGGSGDTTLLLRTLLEMGARDVAFAILWDPEAVAVAERAGVGASLEVDLGGKTDASHGEPVRARARVLRLTDGTFVNTGPLQTGLTVCAGPTALLEVEGVQIVAISRRAAPNDPEILRHVGIDPEQKKILVVKSRGHFRAGYEPFAKEIVEVDCPGTASPNLSWYTYRNVPRPLFPLDDL